MGDVRCPMCGKPNPEDAVICQFCQARLQPVSSPDSGASSSEGGPDWLGKLRGSGGAPENAGSPISDGNDETPDWLARIRSDSSDQIESHDNVQSQSSEIPDWLKALKSVDGEEAVEEEVNAETPEAESEDWLSGLRGSVQPEETDAAGQEEISQPVEPPSTGPFTTSGDQESDNDWLRQFESWQPALQEEQAAAPAEPEAQPAEDTDAWLRSLQNWQPVPSAEEAGEGTIPPETAASMEMLLGESPEQPGETPAASQPEPPFDQTPSASPFSVPVEEGTGSALPDWLSSFQSEQAPAAEGNKEELPDWLSSVEVGAAAPAAAGEGFFNVFEPSTPSEAEEETGETSPPQVKPFVEAGLPDWLTQAQPGAEVPAVPKEQAQPRNPLFGDSLPGWLVGEMPQVETPSPVFEPAEPEEIASAQLPDWVQAMRPVESAAPQTAGHIDEKAIEEAGPLAGMQAVLPVENLSVQYRKPPIYSVKLQMTERQRAYAGLLERTLGEEARPKPAPAKPAGISQRLIRLLIGLLLMMVMLSLVILTPAATPVADLAGSPAVEKFNRAVKSIPDGSVVLVAADFEPGFQGEMRLASRGVLQQLISRNIRLALISSLPSGPVIAANLVSEAHSLLDSSISGGYLLKDQVVNLGYLPGGIVSLQEFALQPRQAVRYGLNSARDGRIVWQNPALNDISQLTDFAAVIVLTDSLDNGRAWIEQVQPALGGKRPFLLVTSAQSAPWIAPYVESGQVSGMLGGVPDAVVFQKEMNVPGIQTGVLYSIQAGSLIGVALVLLGLFLPSMYGLFKRKSEKK